MGRGVSAGGGQSSLGYLFGSGEAPKPGTNNAQAAPSESLPANNPPPSKPAAAPQPADINKQVPAGINSTSTNNYLRADGQNTGNFITELSQRHKYLRKDAIVLVTTKLHVCRPRRMNNTSGSSSSWVNFLWFSMPPLDVPGSQNTSALIEDKAPIRSRRHIQAYESSSLSLSRCKCMGYSIMVVINNLKTVSLVQDRPSTKVHAAPGGGSSLGYLFGGGSN
ncbi:hypothetical protein H0E87_016036 [Populus deltoides]|uniref:Protein SPIRAL1-like 1 n=1 Tax=Populus deltoides TaxID=3696 RepID=A0A8T2Y7K6_POPDE|nr:hypothetical protein H0E87_016036 [Populus deltoides]